MVMGDIRFPWSTKYPNRRLPLNCLQIDIPLIYFHLSESSRPAWLDATARNRHAYRVSRPDGRSRYGRKAAGEESPGSIDIRCRITSGGGDPRDSATENEPPLLLGEGKGEKVR